jgi:hypothetical protein
MRETTDLKSIERQAFLSYHQDGLIDIVAGGVLLTLSLMIWLLPDFWYFLIGGFVAFISVYAAAKKSITVPRMGYVEFSKLRRQRTQYIFLAFVAITVVGNILGIMAMLNPPLGILIFESVYTILIIGLIGGAIFALIGFFSEIWRFHVYGIIFLSSAIFTFLRPFLVFLPLIIVSVCMLVFGAVLLYRFVQRFPKESFGEIESA